MRTMLLSFKAVVFQKVLTGEKIYEHRKVFPNEPVKAYLYVSSPVKAICGVMYLNNKTPIAEWKTKYSEDVAAQKRIDEYLLHYKYAMEISRFDGTNAISLETLRQDIPGFVVPQMYYYIDNSELLRYLEKSLIFDGLVITHNFDNITSDLICKL